MCAYVCVSVCPSDPTQDPDTKTMSAREKIHVSVHAKGTVITMLVLFVFSHNIESYSDMPYSDM